MSETYMKQTGNDGVASTPSLKKYKDDIVCLCHKYTDLSNEEINVLVSCATNLIKYNKYPQEDVFIDIKDSYSEDAIVVFHKKPSQKESMYRQNIIGHRAFKSNEPGVIRTLETGLESKELSAVSQEGIRIQQRVYPIKRKEKVIGTIIVEKNLENNFISKVDNVDGQQMTNSSLSIADVQNIALTEYVDDAVLIFDEYGNLLHHNKAAVKYYRNFFGYLDDITHMNYDNLALDFYKFKMILELVKNNSWEEHSVSEVQYGYHYFSIRRHFVSNKRLIMICKDITDVKQKETRLIAESVAIQEIHHRVKNNLQTIVSLLRLQSRRSQNKEVEKALNDSIGRILSIATTHNLLSKKTEDDVVLFDVLKSTIENIQRFFVDKIDVTIDYNVDRNIILDSNRTVAIALIVNELLQNSFDHAFEKISNRVPCIKLSVTNEDGIIRLEISDNGKGYNANVNQMTTLGLKIVTEFVKSKLSGKLFINSNKEGTTTIVSFKYQKN